MSTDQQIPDDPIQHYSEVLLARAVPVFEQAAESAREAGLHAQVHAQGTPPELCLQVRTDEHGYASHYLIQFDTRSQQVQHQLFFATDGTSRTLPGGVESINNMVLDTQLSDLFREGFSVTLPSLEERHPKGFW